MADAACEDEEMKDTVHVPFLMESVEGGTCDIAHTLGDDPNDGGGGYGVNQRLKGYQHTQAHADKTERLDVGMLLEFDETDDSSCDGTSPDEDKQTPAPIALCSQRHQSQWRIGSCDMPVDGGMVPFT